MSVEPLFSDRHAAGVALADALARYRDRADVVVLGMARGGVMVAAPIARALAAPLDAFVCRKLGVPGLEEVAFGAIAEGGGAPAFDAVRAFIGIPNAVVASVVAREQSEVQRRIRCYRDGAPHIDVTGKCVILVDDGLASGATLKAAGIALRRRTPARLIAAVPVASTDGLRSLDTTFDDVVTVATPAPFGTVSNWYREYSAVDDGSVAALLHRREPVSGVDEAPRPDDTERPVSIPADDIGAPCEIMGDLGRPSDRRTPPYGIVILAHGGGSSRASYRNRYLAARLRLAGWTTLRLDLLTDGEQRLDADGAVRFDVAHITARLLAATRWCIDQRIPGCNQVVLFGASTAAAAAMVVAATIPDQVAAVVARGGRLDLAGHSLALVRAPVLLVVGNRDPQTLQQNRDGLGLFTGPAALRIIRGAGHAFEESGALGRVGEEVTSWLTRLQRKERVGRWMLKPAEWFARVSRAPQA